MFQTWFLRQYSFITFKSIVKARLEQSELFFISIHIFFRMGRFFWLRTADPEK